MRRIPVEVGAAGHEETESRCRPAVAVFGRRVVIGMADLDRIEPFRGELVDQVIALVHAGMCKGREASCLVNDLHDVARRSAKTRHERRAAVFEKTTERFVTRLHVAAGDERVRNLGPSDTAAARRGLENRLRVDRTTERTESIGHLQYSPAAIGPLPFEEIRQSW